MKILIIGADGQLGSDLCKVIPKAEQVPFTLKDIDITNQEQTIAVIKKQQPDVVINTAAFHNVDKCEDEVEQSFAVNSLGVRYLSEACKLVGATLVHLSTDYVFAGEKDKPYVETDCPNPQSIYAISKLAGEQTVKATLDKYFIVRSTGLYGVAGCLGKGGTNFVEGMLKRAKAQPGLRVVDDEVLSPTYTLDLAEKIYELIKTNKYGLYHLVNQGQCSWYQFTCKIFELLDQSVDIAKVTSAEFKAKAKRPKYSVLGTVNLGEAGLKPLRPWSEALQAYLLEKGYLPK